MRHKNLEKWQILYKKIYSQHFSIPVPGASAKSFKQHACTRLQQQVSSHYEIN